jgi:lysophospholipid acyltransferase (LPLAT)-like uncharacterized protein
LNKFFGSKLLHRVLYHLIRTYSLTFRLKVINESEWMHYFREGGRVLLCTWHQQFFAVIRHFKKYQAFNPALMISRSADGDLIAGVARLSGWYAARGSSSRGGKDALKEMIDRLRETGLAAHIVDGPRGPIGIVKPGVIRLGLDSDAVLVPFYVTSDRAWYAKSWDKFLIPKPFANVTIRFGSMIQIPKPASEEDFEHMRRQLENTMAVELKNTGRETDNEN